MPTAPAPNGFAPGQRVVLFDGACRLCAGLVRFILRRDRKGRLLLCALQSPQGQAILRHLGLPPGDFDTMVFLEDGRATYRSEAFLRVAGHLPFPWPLLRLALIVPRPVGDFAYSLLARSRFRLFGRRDTCLVPAPEVESRFLR